VRRRPERNEGCLFTDRQNTAESFIEKIQLAKSSNKV
jgi:predicted RNA-binding protein with PIN domain